MAPASRTRPRRGRRGSPPRRRSPPGRRQPLGRARLAFVGAVVASAIVLFAWFPAGSLLSQRADLHGTEAELHALHAQDSALTQENKNLSDAGEIGRIAREQYQLVSPGQQAYEVLPPAGAAASRHSLRRRPGIRRRSDPVRHLRAPARGVTPPPRPRRRARRPDGARARRRHEAVDHTVVYGRLRVAHGARPRILELSRGEDVGATAPDVRGEADAAAVAQLLGRDPGGAFTVVVRGADGAPMVIANEPFLRDGTPMPTLYWLVDPELRVRVGRLRPPAASGRRESRWTRWPWPTPTGATPRRVTP